MNLGRSRTIALSDDYGRVRLGAKLLLGEDCAS
mgnify:CR=1 FL=1